MRGAHLRRGPHTLTVHGESVLITLGGKKRKGQLASSKTASRIVSSEFRIIHLKTAIVCNDSSWACEEG